MAVDNDEEISIFQRDKVSEKYVALVDILGFSSNVLSSFDAALNAFEAVLRSTVVVENLSPEVAVQIYSDSFLLISDSLRPVVRATRALLMQSLFNDYLVRGAIAHGKHIDVAKTTH